MKAVIIAETDRTNTHIDGKPDIYHNYISEEFLSAYKYVSQNIYKCCRNTEIPRNPAFATIKKPIRPKTIMRMAVFTI